MTFNTLKDFQFDNKVALVRADLNVPVKDGNITDFTRIDRVKPTIDTLKQKNARIAVLVHFGRPKGERKEEYSVRFLASVLSERWGLPVAFAEDCIGAPSQAAIEDLKAGEAVLLENTRFHKGEEKNDPDFTAQLAALGDIYINDAFSAAHRAHASTEGLAQHLPSAAGLLMEAELNALNDALSNPERPVIAIVGGAKISTKLDVLGNLVERCDYLFLGGGMANTFFFAQGKPVGKSLCEKDMADQAKAIMEKAKAANCEIVLPADRVAVREFGENVPHEIIQAEDIAEDQEAIDIGPASVQQLAKILDECRTVLWNGPMGVFEVKPFDKGTNEAARIVAKLTQDGKVKSVAGGGDTVSALEQAGVLEQFSYISTAGGAFLEWLEGKTLPGVAALEKQAKAA